MATCPAKQDVAAEAGRARTGAGLRQFAALTVFTTLDLVRQPISLLLTATCVVLMALASMQSFQFGEAGKFARDSGLALQFVFGLLAGAYGACTTLSGEIRNGTALVVLSKPVGREMFFTAKFAGLASFVCLFSACAIPACILTERAAPELYVTDRLSLLLLLGSVPAALAVAALVNHRWGRPFSSTAFWFLLLFLLFGLGLTTFLHGRVSWAECEHIHSPSEHFVVYWRLLPAGFLVTMALIVLSGIALALATRLTALPVMSISAGVLFLGLLSDYLLAGAGSGPLAAVLHAILPNWQHFWMADALSGGGTIPWRYVAIAGTYAACYLATALAGGLLLFRNREMR